MLYIPRIQSVLYKSCLLIAGSVVVCSSNAQVYKSSEQLAAAFDSALSKMDGAKLLTTLRAKEVQGLKASQVQQFLKYVMKPVINGKGLMVAPGQSPLNWRDPKSKVIIAFQKTGTTNFEVVNSRNMLFKTPVVKEGAGYKSTVSFGQMMFFAAYQTARIDTKRTTSKAQYAQKLVESWIPKLKSLGVKGTVDPEIDQFQTWDVLIKSSRGEITKPAGK
jgi:hypothetical protein